MPCKKIVLLDGTPAGDESLGRTLAMLHEILRETGALVATFTTRDISMAHCTGCFGCWVETPGICLKADSGREIAEAIIQSDITIFFTPVTFGGYSSALKKPIDRRLPLALPFLYREHGETRHPPRYAHYPRVIGIGVQSRPDAAKAQIFKMLVGRNAINSHAPSFAADVFIGSDPPDLQHERLRSLLTRQDAFPFGEAVTSIMPGPVPFKEGTECGGAAKRALLIIGSPKIKSPSTSGVLGTYLLDRLGEQGWQTESLTLNDALLRDKGSTEFLAAVDRADLLILAFPLYIDSLPFLATRALETMAAHRPTRLDAPAQRFVALCNSGFPEARHCAPALAICRQFALQCNITWAGSLALGAGEALCSGDPLSAYGSKGHPPTRHVMQALDLAASALAKGLPVPGQAQKLLEKCPIPLFPFSLWIWLLPKLGGRYFRQRSAQHGVSRQELLNRPYESQSEELKELLNER
jgi:NAD(P)H-dependent FMN reductase